MVSLATSLDVYYYHALVSFAILYYDYTLTMVVEIERFWTSGITWASFFFFFNRYFTLLGHIPIILEFFTTSEGLSEKHQFCGALISYHHYFAVIIQTIVGVMLIMRTYALYNCSQRILALLVSSALVAIAVGCWAVITSRGTDLPVDHPVPTGCQELISANGGIRIAISWSGVLLLDTMIFVLTLYKSVMMFRSARRTLVSILLRDGTVYFGFMLLANIANILAMLLAPPSMKGAWTTFTNVVSSTMISRLMLNLRDPKLHIHSTTNAKTGVTVFPCTSTVFHEASVNMPTVEPDPHVSPVTEPEADIELAGRE